MYCKMLYDIKKKFLLIKKNSKLHVRLPFIIRLVFFSFCSCSLPLKVQVLIYLLTIFLCS